MITLGHMLTLSAILFALSVAGIFINRKNVLLLLMCIELMLLAVNFNFIAFSQHLGDLGDIPDERLADLRPTREAGQASSRHTGLDEDVSEQSS